jgi:hypothetical protein
MLHRIKIDKNYENFTKITQIYKKIMKILKKS